MTDFAGMADAAKFIASSIQILGLLVVLGVMIERQMQGAKLQARQGKMISRLYRKLEEHAGDREIHPSQGAIDDRFERVENRLDKM